MDGVKSYSIDQLKCLHFSQKKQAIELWTFDDFKQGIEHLQLPHRHDFYMFYYNRSGHGKQLVDFHTIEIVPGQLSLLYPGQVHAWLEIESLDGYLIFFTEEFAVHFQQSEVLHSLLMTYFESYVPYINLEPGSHREDIDNLLHCLWNEYTTARHDSNELLSAYLFIVLTKLKRSIDDYRTQQLNQPSRPVLFRYRRLIELHFQKHHGVKEYAELLNLTPNYLNSICKSLSGKSAGELIRERLLLEAKRLLIHEDKTVAEIAYQLGFQDNSYFSRFFKRYTSVTPDSFRKDNTIIQTIP